MVNTNKISIIGAGAWGCGIAQLIAGNGNLVSIFTNDSKITNQVNQHSCPALPGIILSNHITANDDLKLVISNADFLFIVVPSKVILSVLDNLIKNDISSQTVLVLCSKGIDSKNLQLFSQAIEKLLPQNNYAILSGPNFALQVAKGLPSITTIASNQAQITEKVINLLKNKHFLATASNDVIGTQIFGAVKNILAIGCGIVDGLELGENAKAALIVNGTKEMNLLVDKLGGKSSNFVSPAGLGDLFLTCSSTTSRNNKLGVSIGNGKKISDILNDPSKVYEGFEAAQAIVDLTKKYQIKLPLYETINEILKSDLEKEDIKSIISNAILSN